jgi:broad specificity phosphatase PhoE
VVARIFLVRHGQAENNVRGIVSGNPANGFRLTDVGRQQAEALRLDILHESIDLCVVSEFPRARETADLALARRRVPRLVLPEFNDVRADGFEGSPFTSMNEWLIGAGPTAVPPGGGERRVDSVLRVCAGFRRVLGRPEENVLVVDHILGVIVGTMRPGQEDSVVAVVGRRVPYADCYRLTADAVAASVSLVEAWGERLLDR